MYLDVKHGKVLGEEERTATSSFFFALISKHEYQFLKLVIFYM